jgi:hypothetical protein
VEDDAMAELGMKDVNLDNMLEPDSVIKKEYELDAELWTESVLEIALDERVPADVRRHYVACQHSMVYGYLFYPIMTLAAGQLYRVLEATVELRCHQSEENVEGLDLNEKIGRLIETGEIPEGSAFIWQTVGELRDFVSYPGGDNISPPNDGLILLTRVKECLESLYQ